MHFAITAKVVYPERGSCKSALNLYKHLKTQHPKRLKVESVQVMSKALCSPVASASVTEVISSRSESHLTNVASTPTFATSEMGSHKTGSKYQKSPMQQTLTQVIDKTSRFENDDKRQLTITHLIAKMVCVHGQPLNILENRGFTELINHPELCFPMHSRKTLSNVIIPTMYDSAIKNVESQLLEAEFVAITTDLWTSMANTDFLSATAHYVNKEFVLQHLCLDIVPFPQRQKVVAVVRDNARNIVAGLELPPFNHTACLAHTVQLMLRKYSARATKVLKTYQITAGEAQYRLIQEEPTRCNTMLYMLKRLYEQKSDKDDDHSIAAEELTQYFSEEMMTPDCSVTEYWRRTDHCKPLQTLSKKYCLSHLQQFAVRDFSALHDSFATPSETVYIYT
ncbi:hypothetical protein PR048_025968 [Dryococelus australis]|uniref:Transposase n=1 Tax=Dryococelus australis TaxID=614101 RepID=A0ABQ9GK38_9NEOP|nr:hypothetical protein PR048_025968 [Dryococelus australis]